MDDLIVNFTSHNSNTSENQEETNKSRKNKKDRCKISNYLKRKREKQKCFSPSTQKSLDNKPESSFRSHSFPRREFPNPKSTQTNPNPAPAPTPQPKPRHASESKPRITLPQAPPLQSPNPTSSPPRPPSLTLKGRTKSISLSLTPEHSPKAQTKRNVFTDTKFSDLKLDTHIISALSKSTCKYKKPTHIQVKAMHGILNSNRTILKSQTGSGKTLAYLIPILQSMLLYSKQHSVTRTHGFFLFYFFFLSLFWPFSCFVLLFVLCLFFIVFFDFCFFL